MSSETIAELTHVTKTFRVGLGRARVREMIPPPFDAALSRRFPNWWWKNTFNALEDVSMQLDRGVPLGIVGHNGAGKTTMLKVLAGVTEPTSGDVMIRGRTAALLDVLVAFNPELTGRENAYIMGAMYGFNRAQMKEREAQIFEFAEIDDLADTPVKRYSAGMGARLGFAVITALDFDVLMVDEVLAVGDVGFQRKCVRWFEDFRDRGGTLLFVSHNMGLVRSMTERSLWLDHGKLIEEGPTGDVLNRYARAIEHRDPDPSETREMGVRQKSKQKRGLRQTVRQQGMNRWGAGGAQVAEVLMADAPINGQAFDVSISYEAESLEEAIFCLGFIDEMGRELGAATSPPTKLARGAGTLTCTIERLPFRSGIYFPVVAILSPDGTIRDRWRMERALVVDHEDEGAIQGFGPIDIASDWGADG
jgi:ABC-type polysaccharide/polyol phosphate transport system ATPase subunit